MTSGPAFSEIIVPLDGSELSAHALVPGCTIANHLGIAMRVVSFHPPAADGDELREIIDGQLAQAGGISPESGGMGMIPATSSPATLTTE